MSAVTQAKSSSVGPSGSWVGLVLGTGHQQFLEMSPVHRMEMSEPYDVTWNTF